MIFGCLNSSRLIHTLLALLFVVNLNAQTKEIEESDEQWLEYNIDLELTDNLFIPFTAGYRLKDRLTKNSEYYLRAGFGYHFTEEIEVAIVLAKFGYFVPDDLMEIEYRPYQELNITHDFKPFTIAQRLRLEQRFTQNLNDDENNTSFNHRIRYRLLFDIPIYRWNNNELYLTMADEFFINAGKEIYHDVFDQNRLLIGPTFKASDNLSFTLYYCREFASTSKVGSYELNHITWLVINQSVDLRPRKN